MKEGNEKNRCITCDAEIPAAAPDGLCPKCLLMGGISNKRGDSLPLPQRLEDDDATSPLRGGSPPGDVKEKIRAIQFSDAEIPPEEKGAAAFAPSLEEIGKIFPDLEILEFLGAGGMGAVYKARQKRLDRIVALKILSCPPELHESFSLRFEREAQLLAKLHNPHIVTIFDFGEIRDDRFGDLPLFYFLMEYVDGSDLAKRMRAGSLSVEDTLAIIPQICVALQAAHDAGITHRDVKPANMLLDSTGQIRVADFGVAKIVEVEDDAITGLTLTGTTMGTPHYMSPEQWNAPEKVDHRSDIYSLGVIFYQMLTGEKPVGHFAPPSEQLKLDPRIYEIVFKALESQRRDRYQQARNMGADVQKILESQADSRFLIGKSTAITAAVLLAVLAGAAIWWNVDHGSDTATVSITSKATQSPGHSTNDSPTEAGTSLTPVPPLSGRLRAVGTDHSGDPIDLRPAQPFDDFIDIIAERNPWIGLRQNGETVSTDPQYIRSGIAQLVRGKSSAFAFIARDGSVELFDWLGYFGDSDLPSSFEETGVSQLSLGMGHGVALLRSGEVEAWGPRYERNMMGAGGNVTYETEKWPQAPSNDTLQNVVRVAAGATHAAVLHRNGDLTVWGHDGMVDSNLYEQICPIETVIGSGDSFHLLTRANQVYRLRVPRSKNPNSPTGQKTVLQHVGSGVRLMSQFYLSTKGEWKAFSFADEADDLLFQLPARDDIVVSGDAIRIDSSVSSRLFWIEPTGKP